MTLEMLDARQTSLPARIVEPVPPLGRIGSLETRLALSAAEIEAAQRLRYSIFAEEMGARLGPLANVTGLDIDRFDDICDHLVVVDTSLPGSSADQIVGTYRLLRQDVAARHGGFYSAGEFDIAPLLARHPDLRFMELGRSCVLPAWRSRRTMELLWQGNWAYALKHGIDVMFGCASLPGIVPAEHALALSFLHHHARGTEDWTVKAVPGRGIALDMMPEEAVDPRRALAALPPLIKGYLRLGAKIGEEAVVDAAFNCTDVLIMLPVRTISGRYIAHYGADAGRFST